MSLIDTNFKKSKINLTKIEKFKSIQQLYDYLSKKKNNKNYTLITGSTSTIGEKIARKLASKTNLILHGKSKKKLESLKKNQK